MEESPSTKRKMPAWLVGLLIAVAIFVVVIVVAKILGYGDNPAIGAIASR
jgi:hypothetical protein